MDVLKGLAPERVFHYFGILSQYPRGSGNEKAVSDYVVQFAKEREFQVYQDEINNVIIKKPGSAGYEDAEALILQAHLDMVTVADSGVNHNFNRDPIPVIREGDFLTAEGTTLGADNGIGVALIMALLDSDYPHPPLEAIFTTSEEIGLVGAKILDISILKGRKLLNLDSFAEGEFMASSAGGMTHTLALPIEYEPVSEELVCFKIEIKHLTGGHSGSDIHRGLANACKLMGRLLYKINEAAGIRVADIGIGEKGNVIPADGDCKIVLNHFHEGMVRGIINEMQELFRLEYETTDKNIEITYDYSEIPQQVFSVQTTQKLINGLIVIPSGVHSMSPYFDHVVETSNNFAVVKVVNDKIHLINGTRYSSIQKVEFIELNIAVLAELLGAEYSKTTRSPYWAFHPKSPFRDLCLQCYQEATGRAGRVNAIHGGLECSIFHMKNAEMDLVSTGVDIYGPHSTQEKVSISSVQNMWRFILKLAKSMK